MLVGGFEIHVGWVAQFRAQRANGFVRNAAVDPDIDGIVAFRCARRKADLFCQGAIVRLEPNV